MPDVIPYTAAISACEKGQEPRHTLKLLQVIQSKGLMPSVIHYNAASSACEKGQATEQP